MRTVLLGVLHKFEKKIMKVQVEETPPMKSRFLIDNQSVQLLIVVHGNLVEILDAA